MPNPISSAVLAGTDYTAAATIQDVYGLADGSGNGGGTFDVSGGSVYYSLQYASYGGVTSGYGTASWTQESLLRPYSGTIPASAIGVKFRNADAAIPATVSAYIAPPNQPVLQLASANSVGVTGTSMVTGIIPATGTTPTGGTGFTYTHTNASGVYVFTFTNPFSAQPTIEATIGPQAANPRGAIVTAASASGFTVTTFNTSTAAATDAAFMFTASATV